MFTLAEKRCARVGGSGAGRKRGGSKLARPNPSDTFITRYLGCVGVYSYAVPGMRSLRGSSRMSGSFSPCRT